MNESRQTVETDTLWLSKNICALNFRKPGHLRKYCNNENFPIYGIYIYIYIYINISATTAQKNRYIIVCRLYVLPVCIVYIVVYLIGMG